jgi:hypothetical protein
MNWNCCDDGYRWRGKILVPASQSFEPYEVPTNLFLVFAETEPTPDDIQSFANLYGALGIVTVAVRRAAYSPRLSKALHVRQLTVKEFGEPLSDWVAEIKAMKHAVKLYLANKKGSREFWETANAHMRDAVAGQFTNRGEETLVPRNLLGCMWLQLGTKSRGMWRLRRCLTCRAPMPVREMGQRPTRLTCSHSCQVTLSKLRRVYRDGTKTIAEIANRLGTDVKTAKKTMEGKPVLETGKGAKQTRRQ